VQLPGDRGAAVTVYDDFAHHPTAIRTTVEGLRRQVGPAARILAVFEPRTNTMKLGAMKAQLPWSLEQANLAFCHTGGLGWDAREALAPLGDARTARRRVDDLVRPGAAACVPGTTCCA
jgi:UDP-N-acetylmuramate: L-alanyl-gamma-D-glutamyl-meso-diaminopimelate ligase